MSKTLSFWISLLLMLFILSSCGSTRYKANKKRGIGYSHRSKKTKTSREKVLKRDIISSKRQEIVHEAVKHMGVKYLYGGKKPSSGFDCSGFSTFVLNKEGFKIYGSSSQLSKMGNVRRNEDIQPGDLAFFGSKGKVSHVAIVMVKTKNEFRVIHSTSSRGVMESDLLKSKYWNNKYLYTRDVITRI